MHRSPMSSLMVNKLKNAWIAVTSVALVLLACCYSTGADAYPFPKKRVLLFNLDQGFPAGITQNHDIVGLDRILSVLEKFKGQYEVYAIFSPLTAKTDNLHDVLERAAAHHVPFVLDVYTSDALTMGNVMIPANAQADPPHALTTSVRALEAFKADKDLGPYFAGIRLFELMAEDFTVKTCLSKAVDWCNNFKKNVKAGDVLTADVAKPLLEFAKSNNMLVFWSDWKWDSQTAEQQKIIDNLLGSGAYRDTVVLAYANNLPNEEGRFDDSNWKAWVAKHSSMVGPQVLSLGLSNQAWTCDTYVACPIPVIQEWVQRADKAGAKVVQFEPANYFFELPRGGNSAGYPDSPQWRDTAGRPTEQMVLLAKALGVDLTAGEPAPLSRTQKDLTICMGLEVGQGSVIQGHTFSVSVTFRNSGVNAWEPNSLSLVPRSADTWKIGTVSAPSTRVAPGQNTTISFTATAPAKAGKQGLDVSLKPKDGGPFQEFCSRLVSVQAGK